MVAAAQSQANRETAITNAYLNRVNQITPYGSLNYQQSGTAPDGTPLFTATQSFTPEMQRLFDTGMQTRQGLADLGGTLVGQARDAMGQPLDFSGLPELTNDFSGDRERVETALYDRLNPQLQQRRQQVETQLANQGVAVGTEAWRRAMDDLARGENDAHLGVIGQGGQEQSRLYGLALQGRRQGIQERVTQRTQPLNELQAIMGGSQVQNPNFVNVPGANVANTDIAGIYANNYNQQMQAYNQQQSGLGGLFQLGGTLLGGPLGGMAGKAISSFF